MHAVTPDTSAVIGRDFNVAPDDIDVWAPAPAMAVPTFRSASGRLLRAFRARDSSMRTDCITRNPGGTPGGTTAPAIFIKNFAMRIDHLRVTAPLKHRVVWAEIDREARKGKPLPSDHAPLVIDIDSPGDPFDAGWASADSRIAARLRS